jgi:hypothetical protein
VEEGVVKIARWNTGRQLPWRCLFRHRCSPLPGIHSATRSHSQDVAISGYVLLLFHHGRLTNTSQDVRTARFTPCFLPVVTATPAIIAALILLIYSLRTFDAYRPRWTKPFLQETKEKVDEVDDEPKRPSSTATFGLLVTAASGLALQAVTVFLPYRRVTEIYPLIAWVCRSGSRRNGS